MSVSRCIECGSFVGAEDDRLDIPAVRCSVCGNWTARDSAFVTAEGWVCENCLPAYCCNVCGKVQRYRRPALVVCSGSPAYPGGGQFAICDECLRKVYLPAGDEATADKPAPDGEPAPVSTPAEAVATA